MAIRLSGVVHAKQLLRIKTSLNGRDVPKATVQFTLEKAKINAS